MTGRGHEGTFWGDRNVTYLGQLLKGHMCMENSKKSDFIICKFYVNKKRMKTIQLDEVFVSFVVFNIFTKPLKVSKTQFLKNKTNVYLLPPFRCASRLMAIRTHKPVIISFFNKSHILYNPQTISCHLPYLQITKILPQFYGCSFGVWAIWLLFWCKQAENCRSPCSRTNYREDWFTRPVRSWLQFKFQEMKKLRVHSKAVGD